MVLNMEHYKAQKSRQPKHGGSKTILEKWHKDDDNRKSLSDIGWTGEEIIQFDKNALEDHSKISTPKKESLQGPMNHRS